MPIRGIVLLVFILGSLPVCFVRPFYGVLLWTIVAFLNPQRFTWGAAEAFPWALAVAAATLAGFFVFTRGWFRRLASPQGALLFALWIWFTITSSVSAHSSMFVHHAPETWFRFEFVSKILLMTAVTIGVVDSFARLRIFVMVIAGCFGFFILKSLPFLIVTGGMFRVFGPEHSMIGDNNDFGLALNMTLPLYFFLAQSESRRWVKYLFGFLFVATLPVIFFTYSRGAMVGLLVVLTAMLFQLRKALVVVPVIVFGIVIALLFTTEAWKERMDPTRSDAVDASAQSRFNAWTFSWRLACDFPVAGGGFETFTSELFNVYAPNVTDVHGPHSIYFGVLAEHGFIGLGLYLCLVGSCFVTCHQLAKGARFQGDPLIQNYADMFRLSLIGFLISGSFLGRAYFDYFFTIVACIVILNRVARLERVQEVPGGLDIVEVA